MLYIVLHAIIHAELRYETGGFTRDLSHPLKVTTQNTQQNAKHVSATPKFKNIMTSSRPLRIAASVISSVLKMNVSPPQERKKPPKASVGGREGKIERGGPSQTKKYVKQRKTENATSRYPQRAWI